jgi:hypothetical protein
MNSDPNKLAIYKIKPNRTKYYFMLKIITKPKIKRKIYIFINNINIL